MTVLSRHLNGMTHWIDTVLDRVCPWDQDREIVIGPSTEMLQSEALDHITGHVAEPVTFIVLAETGAGDHAQSRVARWCGVAVTALQADMDRSAGVERVQILVGVHGR